MTATLTRRALLRPRAADPLPAAHSVQAADPADLGVGEAAALLRARKLSSAELTDACLARIAKRDGPINAWVRTYPELARAQAAAADRRLAAEGGRAPLLCGVPLALKDLYAVKGLPLTASSKVLAGNVAKGDSTVWARLRTAGMVLLGHTHTHEFAFGTGTPQTGNPWDTTRSPGGSSGGSGAALAARMVPAATGTDTGGSLRSPASACGVSSIKSTYGLVSSYGVIPLVWSLDHAGPMARCASDVALLLAHLAGPDEQDPSTLAPPRPPLVYPTQPRPGARPLAGTRIGVPDGADSGLPAATAELWQRALTELQGLGATLVAFTPPGDEPSILGALPEVWSYHQQFPPQAAAEYTPEVGALVQASRAKAETAASDYVDYQRDRTRWAVAWRDLMADRNLHALVKPGSTVDGATRDQATGLSILSGSVNGDYNWADAAGLPVAMTPAGRSAATGMPFGLQVGGPPHAEAGLLQLVVDYQAHHPYWSEAPKL